MGWFESPRNRIRREASEWVVRLGGDPDPDARAAFARWRAADPRHGEAFERLQRIWTASSALSPGAVRPEPSGRWTPRLALAASLAVVLMATALLLAGSGWLAGSGSEPSGQAVHASAGPSPSAVRLADGSYLILDRDSRVSSRFSSTERRLVLERGRARFIVAKDVRPFVVDAGAALVVATGTRFDVVRSGSGAVVALLEGRVEVRGTDGDPPYALRPGEELLATPGDAPRVRRSGGAREEWPAMVAFDGADLSQVLAIANDGTRPQIRLAEPSIGKRKVAGALKIGDRESLAASLAAALDLELRRAGDGTLILGPPEGRGEPAR